MVNAWRKNLKSKIEILDTPASLNFIQSINGFSQSLVKINQLRLIFRHLFKDEFFLISHKSTQYVARVKQEDFDKFLHSKFCFFHLQE